MRVQVYAEEMTGVVSIVEKSGFTGIRFRLNLPASFVPNGPASSDGMRRAAIRESFQPGNIITFMGMKPAQIAFLRRYWEKQNPGIALPE